MQWTTVLGLGEACPGGNRELHPVLPVIQYFLSSSSLPSPTDPGSGQHWLPAAHTPPACMTGVFCETPSVSHEMHSRPGSSLPHESLQDQPWLRTGPKHESQIGLGSNPLSPSAPLQDPDPWICGLKLVCPARCRENT